MNDILGVIFIIAVFAYAFFSIIFEDGNKYE